MQKEIVKQEQINALAIPDLINEWLDYELKKGASDPTLTAYKKGIAVFTAWVEDRGLAGRAVRPSHIREFKFDLSKEYKPQTVNLRLSAVRSFYRFLVNTDRIPFNPAGQVEGMKRSKSKRHKREALTSEEVLAVLNSCDPTTAKGARDRAIIMLMAFAGLRVIEIHRANIDNLKTEKGRQVLEIQGKGRIEADEIAVIQRNQENVLMDWIAYRKKLAGDQSLFVSLSNRSKGKRMSLRSIRLMIKKRYSAVGVVGENKSSHSLRHSAITTYIKNGGDLLGAQRLARHVSPETTLGYIHEFNRLENPPEDLISY